MTEFFSSRAFEGIHPQNTTKASTKSTTFRDLCFLLVVIATCGIIAFGDRYFFQKEGDLGELYNLCLITAVTFFYRVASFTIMYIHRIVSATWVTSTARWPQKETI